MNTAMTISTEFRDEATVNVPRHLQLVTTFLFCRGLLSLFQPSTMFSRNLNGTLFLQLSIPSALLTYTSALVQVEAKANFRH